MGFYNAENSLTKNQNLIINPLLIFNDTGFVSGTALTNTEYCVDWWKAGIGGATVTIINHITHNELDITAGTLIAAVEGLNTFIESGESYTLGWEGTAQARVKTNSLTNDLSSESYQTSSIEINGQLAGQDLMIEVGAGTFSKMWLKKSKGEKSFSCLDVSLERIRSQRFVVAKTAKMSASLDTYYTKTFASTMFSEMRVTPSIDVSGASLSGHHGSLPDTVFLSKSSVVFQWSGVNSRDGAMATVIFKLAARLL